VCARGRTWWSDWGRSFYLRLDGLTYMQRLLDGGGRAERHALGDDASSEKVAETNHGELGFLGRVSRPR
jgi:hypothetical protein